MTDLDLARRKNFCAKRESSYDRSGDNADLISFDSGETKTIAELDGPGAISHIWFTIACEDDLHYLRKLLLRVYWDGAERPGIESPVGDFFNVGHSFSATHSCAAFSTSTADQRLGGRMAMNCWLPMPFREHARVEIANESEADVRSFYYYVDYRQQNALDDDIFYLHAQWKRENPCDGWTGPGSIWHSPAWSKRRAGPEGKNLDGKGNYVVLDAEGEGHFVGCNLSVYNHYRGWWGEGDDMFFVDGQQFPPDLHGTGTEDYFGHAWGMQNNQALYHGVSLWAPHNPSAPGDAADWVGFWTMYRLHLLDPVPFTKSLVMGIEHGHANNRSDDWSSVAYWYQNTPEHKQYTAMPPADERAANQV